MFYGNQKAWVAALSVIVTYGLALFGVGDMPDMGSVTEAAKTIGGGLVMAVLGYAATWLVSNKPKE